MTSSKNGAPHKGKGGLGKGLGALMGNTPLTPAKDKVQEIAVAAIQANRYQPLQEFEEGALSELCDSIKAYGVLQPLLVRRLSDGQYELIAGERRLRAARMAGLAKVPAMVREYNDAEISEIALIENIQRENLNAIEEAQAYGRLMQEFGLTQEALATKMGRSRSHIANFLRLLKLAAPVQQMLAEGSLSMGQAKPLLALEDEKLQQQAATYVMDNDLSARQCEALVKRLQTNPQLLMEQEQPQEKKQPEQSVFLRDITNRLTHLLGTQVHIRPGKKKSKIEIEFYSQEDLERILSTMSQEANASRQQKIEALRKVSLSHPFTV